MKNVLKINVSLSFLVLAFFFCFNSASAQPPVTTGLNLYLDDAATNFTNATSSPASWTDNSGSGNTMVSTSVAESPAYNSTVNGVDFDGGDDYMLNATLNSTFSEPHATLFVVRKAITADNMMNSDRTLLSISDDNIYDDEFGLLSDWAIHHSSSGNWTRKSHQCYADLPDNEPVILTALLKEDKDSVDYYVNGIKSTESLVAQSTASDYTTMDRRIYLGARRCSDSTSCSFFEGTIYEVLAYNRILTASEIEQVNNYLKCKYSVNYASCNEPIACDSSTSCSDVCYWRVTGNNIIGGNNKFGTLTNDPVNIYTNNSFRGIFDNSGRLGWNTNAPTAWLHINCVNGNDEKSGLSDVRFERLEHNQEGNILIINREGYVFDSGMPLGALAKSNQELSEKYEALLAEVEDLKRQLSRNGANDAQAENQLFQNTPNPYHQKTVIEYEIGSMNHQAMIAIYDLNGKQLYQYAVNKKGRGKLEFDSSTLSPGMYLYSLIIDGSEIDTKKMVVSK